MVIRDRQLGTFAPYEEFLPEVLDGHEEMSSMQARIRYQFVDGLDSRGRCWGHLTLVVRSLIGPGTCGEPVSSKGRNRNTSSLTRDRRQTAALMENAIGSRRDERVGEQQWR
jgi:hypothetical protein